MLGLTGRAAASVGVAVLLSACGPHGNALSAEDRRRIDAPLPATSATMRAELDGVRAMLAASDRPPGTRRADEHVVACGRLFDLVDLLESDVLRFDMSRSAYMLLSDANRGCDERPREAAQQLGQALAEPAEPDPARR